MRPETFRAACQILWGEGGSYWGATEAALFLRVNARNVYYWAAGTKEVPPGAAAELAAELRRRLDDPKDFTPAVEFIREAKVIRLGNQAA